MPFTSIESRSASGSERVSSIDILRGMALIAMVLDHVRSFFHHARFSPMDLSQSDPVLFLTRFVTHPAAPVFFLLAGTASYLFLRKSGDVRAVSRFLILRGLLLVLLEVTVVNASWFFSLSYEFVNLQTIWTLGLSMILLALLVKFPPAVAGIIGVALVAGHNLLDSITFDTMGSLGWLWKIAHQYSTIKLGAMKVRVVFPLLPWFGVMAAGYWLGTLFDLPPGARRKRLLAIGLALTAAFFIIRFINAYGDPYPWYHHRRGAVFTVLSFFNCEKYPPSLSFLLVTLGPALITLGMLEGVRSRVAAIAELFGRVPLFFYLLHLPLVHLLAVAAMYWRYREVYLNRLIIPDGFGFGLDVVLVFCALTVAALYPLCRRYDALRRGGKLPLLRYF